MMLRDAQRDLRTVFLCGFPGGLTAGLLWLISAAAATWISRTAAVQILIFGGPLIFPGALLVLRLMGRSTKLAPGNPLGALAMQVAFTVPLAIPVILAAASGKPGWFYPAFMIIVGAHYLPFIFLYGMWQFAVLAGVLTGGGLLLRALAPSSFALGAWLTGGVLLAFAVYAWFHARREAAPAGEAARSAGLRLAGNP